MASGRPAPEADEGGAREGGEGPLIEHGPTTNSEAEGRNDEASLARVIPPPSFEPLPDEVGPTSVGSGDVGPAFPSVMSSTL